MTHHLPLFRCCLCDDVVLGICGQDDILDTVYLLDGPDDKEAVGAGIFGAVHLRCLSQTKWGTFWSNRRFLNATCVGRAVTLFEDAELSIGIQPVTEEIIVASRSGSFLLFEQGQLERRVATSRGSLVPFVSELGLSLRSSEKTAQRILREWETDGHSSLLKLIQDFNVEHRLKSLDAVKNGILLPTTDADVDPNLMLRQYLLEATIEHDVFIPESEMKKILRAIQPGPT